MTHTSKPDQWTHPRWRDRARDEYHFGALRPMQTEQKGIWPWNRK